MRFFNSFSSSTGFFVSPSGRLHGRLHNRALVRFQLQCKFVSNLGGRKVWWPLPQKWSLEPWSSGPCHLLLRVFSLNWSLLPGDSSRDLFIPKRWRSLNHWKGSRELTIPKRSPAELPGWGLFVELPLLWNPMETSDWSTIFNTENVRAIQGSHYITDPKQGTIREVPFKKLPYICLLSSPHKWIIS